MKKNVLFLCIIFISIGILFNKGIVYCWSPDNRIEYPFLSIEANRIPLRKVLDEFSGFYKYQIIISDEWSKCPVTIALKDVTLIEGLARIFGQINYTMIINELNRTIEIVTYGIVPYKEINKDYLKTNKWEVEVIPPANSGERGVTFKQFEDLRSPRKRDYPKNIPIVPP